MYESHRNYGVCTIGIPAPEVQGQAEFPNGDRNQRSAHPWGKGTESERGQGSFWKDFVEIEQGDTRVLPLVKLKEPWT